MFLEWAQGEVIFHGSFYLYVNGWSHSFSESLVDGEVGRGVRVERRLGGVSQERRE